MSTRVVNVKLGEPFDVYIGRTMKQGYYGKHPVYRDKGWGNPFRAGYNAVSVADVLNHYRVYLLNQPKLLARILLGELRDKTLGCWCAPPGGLDGNVAGHVCHGEILAALADDATPADTLREWVRTHELLAANINGGKTGAPPATRRCGTFAHGAYQHTWVPWASDPRFEHCVCGASRRIELQPVLDSDPFTADPRSRIRKLALETSLEERERLASDPLTMRCPHCGAEPGQPCIGPHGITHAARGRQWAKRRPKRQAAEVSA